MKKYNLIFLGLSMLVSLGIVSTASIYASFSDNGSVPPNNNAAAPLNVSGATQTKQGVLQSASEIQAPVFRSNQNGNYYIHPIGGSRLNAVYVDFLYSYGTAEVHDIYLRSVGRWASQLGSPTCNWGGARIVSGDNFGCQNDITLYCTNGRITTININC